MVRSGVEAFVEVGSGSVLIGLIRRIDKGVEGHPLGTPVDFESLEG
jgi:[acyl-carrier-protein] S-malonyltransferase